ncbi:MAG: tRNA (adenosine(37)-N6)-threonylcarbamoyltransferase complex ATPase subunit type 1 TsaE [Candidatus Moranbacteria bacterium RIFOXYA12_FULL_44_15]|nr:MAG: tRNA (adenosine(37)-N6)-threonylcarbamoyltransferase complex ATPase subunit type 1 TsaE [Candidatus Moranbacteria bacterium RIFOXYA12_FULL_44_15]OGI34812.1 MAG: tRNA (adenosine(37)-N6)-threonylcarbamoyltransferase complex ATPase subunit type 1 TsaE [Candidatus Moranbacteria bacterium RIFOXYA2_FULL_43_15]
MENIFVTNNSEQTRKLGEILASELKGGEVVCLSGDLGAGKTTFTQGLLKGLGVKGPYMSPTFLIMKEYKWEITNYKLQITNYKQITKSKIQNIYHVDAYRVDGEDMLGLGWEEIVADKNNVIIVEWAERICDIIPENSLWVRFEWIGENERRITFGNSPNF